ncbi:hypothetical protein [Flavobacterium sangjuense]|uniref:Uncharacterized protein n=1 Tax=Flavobacterium sangjuense TaxID=2518177 RepID=A0A4P7PWG0_9FLAO|nr:hypothetical protein [Flavobacterium sangjuense]QBZ98652.1 hypothetical protein GS03_02161 [Flavobacterium sangjuense]
MKATKLFMLATLLVVAFSTQAQVAVNVNIGTPPVWAPAAPVEVHYYYLPDIEVYYDVPARSYIYISNGRWIRSHSLPYRYRGYDLYHGRTVYLRDYRGNAPYRYYSAHKVKYGGKKWKGNGHDNGNHYGQAKGNGKGNGNGKGKGKGHGKK